MVPKFNSDGVLPPGVHPTTLDEFEKRFVYFDKSDRRYRIFGELQTLIKEAKQSGIIRRIVVAGSFVTNKAEPNDFDCILVLDELVLGKDLSPVQYNVVSHQATRRRFDGDVLCAVDDSEALARYLEFFQRSRTGTPVGIVEIEL